MGTRSSLATSFEISAEPRDASRPNRQRRGDVVRRRDDDSRVNAFVEAGGKQYK